MGMCYQTPAGRIPSRENHKMNAKQVPVEQVIIELRERKYKDETTFRLNPTSGD